MKQLKVEAAALLEVRRPGSSTSVDGYNYYWSGHNNGHNLWHVISSKPQASLVEVTLIDETLCKVTEIDISGSWY